MLVRISPYAYQLLYTYSHCIGNAGRPVKPRHAKRLKTCQKSASTRTTLHMTLCSIASALVLYLKFLRSQHGLYEMQKRMRTQRSEHLPFAHAMTSLFACRGTKLILNAVLYRENLEVLKVINAESN